MLNPCSFLWVLTNILIYPVFSYGIIGGHLAQSFPFFVRVELNEPKKFCGGTIVAPDVVVTAAHCLYHFEERSWALKEEISVVKGDFSKLTWRRTAEWFSLENYITHDLYNPNLYYGISPYDIALIKLRRYIDLSDSRNGLLDPCPYSEIYSGGLAIGMGLVFLEPEAPAIKLMGKKYFRDPGCGEYGAYGLKILKPIQVCYKDLLHQGICDGDAGSPIVSRNAFTGEATCFIGIASFGASNCSDSRFPSVFTRAGYFKDWIDRYILLFSNSH